MNLLIAAYFYLAAAASAVVGGHCAVMHWEGRMAFCIFYCAFALLLATRRLVKAVINKEVP